MLRRSSGEAFPVEVILRSSFVSGENCVLAVVRDITERKRAEEEHAKLQAQFVQSQKMESVGRLAGGVAHDFNNMLSVILGNADLALCQMDPSQPLYADLVDIRDAARRSADLTRQLLAFARKQTVAPRVLDLNEVVAGMLKMLTRLIGEDIDLAWFPGEAVWPVKMDPAQVDQLLANLCINARDAIDGVGKITIETSNTVFDAAYCAAHPGFVMGEYATLSVSDDGCGMDKNTQDKIFEPFFTTKGIGQGTGLGLATVYGIVKQNDGFINVYSEPGEGSTFRIYLARHQAEDSPSPAQHSPSTVLQGNETILLVEDDPTIRKVTQHMLERLGYTVISAARPEEAIGTAESHQGQIHLLLTDVVMPEMTGRELAERLQARDSGLKCLYMSGYTANVIAHHGVLDAGVHFIPKPFSVQDLADKIREALSD
jgi:signal transduction histidine kinase/CheY-like chemotaxis protein